MSPAMNTASRAKISMAYRPEPVPPGLTSPYIMLTRARPPPSGVRLSCAQLTAPSTCSVVEPAKSRTHAGPKRASLPSMLPPACVAVTVWFAPSGGELRVAARLERHDDRASIAQPQHEHGGEAPPSPASGRRAILPNVKVSANGMASISQICSRFVIAVGVLERVRRSWRRRSRRRSGRPP